MTLLPVLEIGGTHVSAGIFDSHACRVERVFRYAIDADASADQLLDAFAAATAPISSEVRRWAVAIPGPFDYIRGIGAYAGIGKFAALDGVDVGAGLRERIDADGFVFVNDADAFAVGQWHAAGRPSQRGLYLTMGTGVGSSFLDAGRPVGQWPGIPEGGRMHLVTWGGRPLEETVSRKAIQDAYETRMGDRPDVREICDRARHGDVQARQVLSHAFGALGEAVGPLVDAFGVSEVCVGGSMAGSWDVIASPLGSGIRGSSRRGDVALRRAQVLDSDSLVGAALLAHGTYGS